MTTLQDLRNNATAAFADFMEYRKEINVLMYKPEPKRPGTMRQVWKRNKRVLNSHLNADHYNEVLSKLDRACEIYYHAKKYGLQSAMLMKLSYDN
jgi:hypothetical protein